MVVDSSALLAILQLEPEHVAFSDAMFRHDCLIGAATLFEVSMIVLSRRGDGGLQDLNDLLHENEVEVAPVSEHHAALALDAFRRFGKGRHQAGLNYGDCMAYALAMATDLPLLFKGDDFIHTDVRAAV